MKFARYFFYLILLSVLSAIWIPSIVSQKKVDIGEMYLERQSIDPQTFKKTKKDTTPKDSIAAFSIDDDFFAFESFEEPITEQEPEESETDLGVWVTIAKELITHLNELVTLIIGVFTVLAHKKTKTKQTEE